jgi:hypothetical protein
MVLIAAGIESENPDDCGGETTGKSAIFLKLPWTLNPPQAASDSIDSCIFKMRCRVPSTRFRVPRRKPIPELEPSVVTWLFG